MCDNFFVGSCLRTILLLHVKDRDYQTMLIFVVHSSSSSSTFNSIKHSIHLGIISKIFINVKFISHYFYVIYDEVNSLLNNSKVEHYVNNVNKMLV